MQLQPRSRSVKGRASRTLLSLYVSVANVQTFDWPSIWSYFYAVAPPCCTDRHQQGEANKWLVTVSVGQSFILRHRATAAHEKHSAHYNFQAHSLLAAAASTACN